MFSNFLQHFQPKPVAKTVVAEATVRAQNNNYDEYNSLVKSCHDAKLSALASKLKALEITMMDDHQQEEHPPLSHLISNLVYIINQALIESSNSTTKDALSKCASNIKKLDDSVLGYYQAQLLFVYLDYLMDDTFDIQMATTRLEINHVLEKIEEFVNNSTVTTTDEYNEIKFHLHLVRALYWMNAMVLSKKSSGIDDDLDNLNVNRVKKELRSALEMCQHWLTNARQSSSTTTTIPYNDVLTQKPTKTIEESIKQNLLMLSSECTKLSHGRWNQGALLLKARYESFKYNNRKALRLCQEASKVFETFNNKRTAKEEILDDVQYLNHLGCIHISAGKLHTALYYFREALSKLLKTFPETFEGGNTCKNGSSRFPSFREQIVTIDGRTYILPIRQVLYNCACSAAHAEEYESAYEYMSAYLKLIANQNYKAEAKDWLLLTETCLGIHSHCKKIAHLNTTGISHQINNITGHQHQEGKWKDLSFVLERPLESALSFLMPILTNHSINDNSTVGRDIMEATLVNLAYIKLELYDFAGCLAATESLLGLSTTDNDNDCPLSRKRTAYAKLYRAQALRYMNKGDKALEVIFGKTDHFELSTGAIEKLAIDMMGLSKDKLTLRININFVLQEVVRASLAIDDELSVSKTMELIQRNCILTEELRMMI